jgi:flagellar hook-basal body complex protein FliE
MNVGAVGSGVIAPITLSNLTTTQPASGAQSFSHVLEKFLDETNSQQLQADHAVQQLATGQSDSIPETMMAMAKADLSFRVFMEVRNKVIEAYQEVMRMQM